MKPTSLLFLAILGATQPTVYQPSNELSLRGSQSLAPRLPIIAAPGNVVGWLLSNHAPSGLIAGASVGALLDGKKGTIKDGAIGLSLGLAVDVAKRGDAWLKAATNKLMGEEVSVRRALMRGVAQDYRANPNSYDALMTQFPEWHEGIGEALFIDSIPESAFEAVANSARVMESMKSFFSTVAFTKYAWAIGAGIAVTGVIPDIVVKISKSIEGPPPDITIQRSDGKDQTNDKGNQTVNTPAHEPNLQAQTPKPQSSEPQVEAQAPKSESSKSEAESQTSDASIFRIWTAKGSPAPQLAGYKLATERTKHLFGEEGTEHEYISVGQSSLPEKIHQKGTTTGGQFTPPK